MDKKANKKAGTSTSIERKPRSASKADAGGSASKRKGSKSAGAKGGAGKRSASKGSPARSKSKGSVGKSKKAVTAASGKKVTGGKTSTRGKSVGKKDDKKEESTWIRLLYYF